MKKMAFFVIMLLVVFGIQPVFAADPVEVTSAAATEVVETAKEVAGTAVEAPVEAVSDLADEITPEVPAPAAEPAVDAIAETPAEEAPVLEAPVVENLEFVSGEVTSLDEAASKLSIKLYGETGDGSPDKSITVSVDPNTDITDGEKDRELKSLAPGTEVDVEYDPASSKATYIFVY
jgi:hypothetical protein